MAALVAKKITKQTPQSKQLSTFVASLGVPYEVELYSHAETTYINSEVLLPILSVDIQWFIKNAESPLHYIKINKQIFINKYGMTKLLGQSKQPAAFKLQDYLYEIFYKVETEGFVERDSVESRKKLLSMSGQLETFRTVAQKNQQLIEEAQEAAKVAQLDCDAYAAENNKLKKENEQLESENKELTQDLETFRSIANKLSRYVRAKSKNPPDEAYDDNLDQEDDDEISELKVVREAIKAKALLKEESKGRAKVTPRTPQVTPAGTKTYYLFRSTDYVSEDCYHWTLTDKEPSEEIMQASQDFLLEDQAEFPYRTVLYRTVHLTQEKKNVIVLFFELTNGVMDDSTMSKLIN